MHRLCFSVKLVSSVLFINLCFPASHYFPRTYADVIHMTKDTFESQRNLEVSLWDASENAKDFNQKDSEDNSSLIVETRNGKVQGVTLTASNGEKVDAWLGIPYAQKPIGKLRFRPPKPIENWDGIINATELPNTCVQIPFHNSTTLSEDCLYLNVVVPKPRPTNATVMVWIYGGAFTDGSSADGDFNPEIIVTEGKVIYVSMQYRVSSLGFLYFGTSDVPGNAGLLDQNMAIQWVHDNIAAFGGNPNNITLFGESAGSLSVSFHLLSPLSRDLFSQGIMESGTALSPSGITSHEKSILRGLQLAEAVNCSHDRNNLEAVTDCLETIDPLLLVRTEWATLGICEIPFGPVVDGTFLVEHPVQALQNNNFKKTNILIGSNENEGYIFLINYLPELFPMIEDVYVNRTEYLRAAAAVNNDVDAIAREAILFEYTDWLNPKDMVNYRDTLNRMVGDYQFICPGSEFAHTYAETGNTVYFYQFAHKTEGNSYPSWTGAMHGQEIAYVYGAPLNSANNYTSEEIDLSKQILQYWINFAKTGNPNLSPDGTSTSTVWPTHTVDGWEYLFLETNSTAARKWPRIEQCAFWMKYIPRLMEMTASLKDNQTESCTNGIGRLTQPMTLFHFIHLAGLTFIALNNYF